MQTTKLNAWALKHLEYIPPYWARVGDDVCVAPGRGRNEAGVDQTGLVLCSAPSVFTITEKAPTRAFSWLKGPTSAFTFKTLLRHYAKEALNPPHGKKM